MKISRPEKYLRFTHPHPPKNVSINVILSRESNFEVISDKRTQTVIIINNAVLAA